MTRPLQPHGTTARASGRPDSGVPRCYCDPCVTARRDYQNKRQALRALGHPGLVPSKTASRHAQRLTNAGVSWQEILLSAGVSRGVLAKLLAPTGESITITATTASRILGVPIPAVVRSGERRVDGIGTQRRLRALARIGWPCRRLAAELGVSSELVARWRLAQSVTVGTRARVRELYRRLENTPGSSRQVALRAEREGWPSPADWDGLAIDDPAVAPLAVAWEPPRPLVVAENVEFIRRTTGVADLSLIAERLGITRETLDRNLDRTKVLTRELVAA